MQKLPLVLAIIGVTVGALALIFGFQLFPMLMKKKITAVSLIKLIIKSIIIDNRSMIFMFVL